MSTLFRRAVPAVAVALIAAATLAVGAGTASAAIEPASGCEYTAAEPEIQEGNTGIAVEQAQCELNANWQGPADIPVDGIFGPQTRDRTIAFQNCTGLTPDGIIGPLTWATLDYYNQNLQLSCG